MQRCQKKGYVPPTKIRHPSDSTAILQMITVNVHSTNNNPMQATKHPKDSIFFFERKKDLIKHTLRSIEIR